MGEEEKRKICSLLSMNSPEKREHTTEKTQAAT